MREPNTEEVERQFRSSPFVRTLGIQLVSLGLGECHTVLTLAERHLQQDGYVHTGVLAAIADQTAGAAAASFLRGTRLIVGIGLKMDIFKAVTGARLSCAAKVLKPGWRLIVVESEVHCHCDADSQLVSKATLTMMAMDMPSGC